LLGFCKGEFPGEFPGVVVIQHRGGHINQTEGACFVFFKKTAFVEGYDIESDGQERHQKNNKVHTNDLRKRVPVSKPEKSVRHERNLPRIALAGCSGPEAGKLLRMKRLRVKMNH